METTASTEQKDSKEKKDSKEDIKHTGKVFDYKNLDSIQKYTSERGKILPRRLTSATAKEQRKLAQAIKRARFLALISPLNN